MNRIAVIDIGKTNAKLALVDLGSLRELEVLTRPNRVRPGPPWPHFDLDGHWDFILAGLAGFRVRHGVDAVSITTHGASLVLLDAEGGLAAPMLDYEHDGPEALAAEYDALRPGFEATGSPRLGLGLNAGAQLHWMFAQDAGLGARVARIVTYPQYWAGRLTGVAATEATSLGCHTDLWEPRAGRPSALVDRLGIAGKLAPLRRAAEVLGPVTAEVARATGLAPGTPVHCGIHDSNASLLPHLMRRTPPFSVVSTGTWVVVMTLPGAGAPLPALDPARDTLVNVSAFGQPVPSARFMGGREHDLMLGGAAPDADTGAVAEVVDAGVMLLPSVVPGSGPFRGREAAWRGGEPPMGAPTRSAVVAHYLAMMTAECLALTGHRGPVVVEGPFARNGAYLDLLSAATGETVAASEGSTGTSQGCALLAAREAPAPAAGRVVDRRGDAALAAHAAAWRAAVAAG
ncbi:FGGY-family carbohydrate kinase [Vannielia litorea]|uniref:Sugar (Pentulose or hexulose) kinase n=1 Tax=Vannielia litorea TaxID=1217970 RepID=A0A1N6FW68_9RHOB|nr:FGGY-family carbohydrate kinase [Vannielia litorea]SIN99493.1 Sugar (pentulose or hexulose) kinase [Vannielia litorea]